MIPLLTGIIGIATALTIVILIRRDRLHVRYGLWWMAAAGAFALMGLFPRGFDQIAAYLGVAYPPVLALTLGLVILVIKILEERRGRTFLPSCFSYQYQSPRSHIDA